MIFSKNKYPNYRSNGRARRLVDDLAPLIGRVRSNRGWRISLRGVQLLRSLRQGFRSVTGRANGWLDLLRLDGGVVILVWAGKRRKSLVIDLSGKRRRPRVSKPAAGETSRRTATSDSSSVPTPGGPL